MSATEREPPVLVFGALRSGTTLFRLMLDAHEDLSNPGEVDFLFDFLSRDASGKWRYDFDQLRANRNFQDFCARGLRLPANLDGLVLLRDLITQLAELDSGTTLLTIHRNAPIAAATMPGARVIHLLRDPRDVARSSIGMGWAGNLYYGVEHWIATEIGWETSTRKGSECFVAENILELRFEALLHKTETELRRVCDFLGVPFSRTMLEYHKASTYGPPDPDLAEQWRRKCTTHDVALVECRLGPLLQARGYAPSGYPAARPDLFERCQLFVENKFAKWAFSVRRFGLQNVAAEKFSRYLHLRRWNWSVKARMQEITRAHLK